MGNKRLQTRSVRIDEDVDARLRALSGEQGLSVNSLVTRAISRFVEWDSYGEKFGFIDMPSSVVARLLAFLDETELRELGRWAGSSLLREYVLFWFKEVTPETVLRSYPRLASRYGRFFEFAEHEKGGTRSILFKHAGGRQLSVFFEEALRAAFDEVLKVKADIESTDNQVVARFSASAAPPSGGSNFNRRSAKHMNDAGGAVDG